MYGTHQVTSFAPKNKYIVIEVVCCSGDTAVYHSQHLVTSLTRGLSGTVGGWDQKKRQVNEQLWEHRQSNTGNLSVV